MNSLKRILHVDDDADIRTVTRTTLELIGKFEVSQFSSGAQALAGAQVCAAQLCLLDLAMPRMNGDELWRRLRLLPGMATVPAVFMTAKAEKPLAQTLIAHGALAVVVKPFDPVDLCHTIRDAWQRHILVAPA